MELLRRNIIKKYQEWQEVRHLNHSEEYKFYTNSSEVSINNLQSYQIMQNILHYFEHITHQILRPVESY